MAGQLDVRLYVMLRDSNDRLEVKLKNYKMIGLGNEFLTVRALKRSIDGALGPHGAWLLAPYSDLPWQLRFEHGFGRIGDADG